MKTEQLDTKYGLLWYVVLDKYLQGATTSPAIAKALELGSESLEIRHILNDPNFRLAVYMARKDPAATALKYIQQNLITYTQKMHGLALDDGDKRSQVAALKDLMDRGGMKPPSNINIAASPRAYKDAVSDLVEEETPLAIEALAPAVPEITE